MWGGNGGGFGSQFGGGGGGFGGPFGGGGGGFQVDPGFGGPNSFSWGGSGGGGSGPQTFQLPGGGQTFNFPGETIEILPPPQTYPGGPQQTSPVRPGGGFGLIGGLNGPAAGVIKGSLGPSLGGLLNTVAASGVGGVVTSDPQGGGCRAGNVANVVRELFNALQIELRQCNSGADCSGIGNGQCGMLGGAPNVGKVCRY